jgi:hypothetical protein
LQLGEHAAKDRQPRVFSQRAERLGHAHGVAGPEFKE